MLFQPFLSNTNNFQTNLFDSYMEQNGPGSNDTDEVFYTALKPELHHQEQFSVILGSGDLTPLQEGNSLF